MGLIEADEADQCRNALSVWNLLVLLYRLIDNSIIHLFTSITDGADQDWWGRSLQKCSEHLISFGIIIQIKDNSMYNTSFYNRSNDMGLMHVKSSISKATQPVFFLFCTGRPHLTPWSIIKYIPSTVNQTKVLWPPYVQMIIKSLPWNIVCTHYPSICETTETVMVRNKMTLINLTDW